MNNKDAIESYTLHDFNRQYRQEFFNLYKAQTTTCDIVVQVPYSNTKEYKKDDICHELGSDYLIYKFTSKVDNNIGHDLNDADYWLKTQPEEKVILKDIFEKDELVAKDMMSWCFAKRYNIVYVEMYSLLLACFCYNRALTDYTDSFVSSSSIDGLALSKSLPDFLHKNPFFNNVFGIKFKQLLDIYYIKESEFTVIKGDYTTFFRQKN